eukprot:scaffold26665_cov169-Skeletonema_menzelii.AAC.7
MTGFETVIVAEHDDVEAASPTIGQPSPPLTSSAPRKNKSAFSCVLPFFGAILVLCFIGLVAGFVTQTIHVSDRQQTQALAALPSTSKSWTLEQCTDEPLEHLKSLFEADLQDDNLEATLVAYFTVLFENCKQHYAVVLGEVFTKAADLSTSTISERSVQCAEDIFADLTSPDEDKVNPISIGDILDELRTETNQTMSPSATATATPPPPAGSLTLAPVLLQTHQISTSKNASSSTKNEAGSFGPVNWTSFAEEFDNMAEKEKPPKATTTGLSKLSSGSGTTPSQDSTQQPSSTGINHPTMAPSRVESISMLPSKGSSPKKKQKDTPRP